MDRTVLISALAACSAVSPALAQSMQQAGIHAHETSSQHDDVDHSQMDHSRMDHSQMDHSQMDQSQIDHSQIDHSQMDHSQMDHSRIDRSKTDHAEHPPTAPALPREPIPVPTAQDLAAAFPPLLNDHRHATEPVAYVLVDRLEGWDRQAGNGQAWEIHAWYGGDIHRLRLRSEGERGSGRTHAADVELLYGQAISPWWEVVAGVRQDFAPGPALTRAAVGLRGLAPYKFEVDATLYLGGDSLAEMKFEAEYTLLLSQRWILQPRAEARLAARDDRARAAGAGLEAASLGLRLRYEVSRRFAPYVGWEHERHFGKAAEFLRSHQEPARESRFVAGVRFWF